MPQDTLAEFLGSLRLRRGETLLAACSGGADSTALLAGLVAHATRFRCMVAVLHCDHGLRGAESRRDAAFVGALAKSFKVPLKSYRKKLAPGPGLEERGRAWRRECYARAAAAFGARFVFLGHHAGDQAETLLMNLIRGAGARGAGGMRALSPLEGAAKVRLARPYLETSPQDLRAWLGARGLDWREDDSNQSQAFKRNVLRHRVLGELESLLPGATRRLAAFARRSAEAAGALDQALARIELGLAKAGSWDAGALKALPRELRRALIFRLGGRVMDEASVDRVEALLEKKAGSADLRRGLSVSLQRGRLRLRK